MTDQVRKVQIIMPRTGHRPVNTRVLIDGKILPVTGLEFSMDAQGNQIVTLALAAHRVEIDTFDGDLERKLDAIFENNPSQ